MLFYLDEHGISMQHGVGVLGQNKQDKQVTKPREFISNRFTAYDVNRALITKDTRRKLEIRTRPTMHT